MVLQFTTVAFPDNVDVGLRQGVHPVAALEHGDVANALRNAILLVFRPRGTRTTCRRRQHVHTQFVAGVRVGLQQGRIEGENVLLAEGAEVRHLDIGAVEVVLLRGDLGPELRGERGQTFGLLQTLGGYGLLVAHELFLAHVPQVVVHRAQKVLHALVHIRGVAVRLHDDTQALHAVGAPDAAEHDVAELLLGAQDVEARLVDDLREQLQQHVVLFALHTALVVQLHAGRAVHVVLHLVQIIASVLQFQLPVQQQLSGQKRGHGVRAGQSLLHNVHQLQSLLCVCVSVHQALDVHFGQHLRDESL